MKPIDPQKLWNDAIDEIPDRSPASPLQEFVSAERSRRQRQKILRGIGLAVLVGCGGALWRAPHPPAEVVSTLPQVVPAAVSVPPTPSSTPKRQVEVHPLAQTPPARQRLEAESVPVREFLRQLPHHGYMTVTNEQGRFLVIVDNSTGESFTSRLPDNEQF